MQVNPSHILDDQIPKEAPDDATYNKKNPPKKQNTILESFYTEEMDFYDLEEEEF